MTDPSTGTAMRGTSPDRRLIAVGIVRRRAGRTTTVRATTAGVTGSITPTGGTR